jgi:hypothetical protein
LWVQVQLKKISPSGIADMVTYFTVLAIHACHLINETQYNGCGLIDTIMISNLTIHYSATSKDLQQIKIKKSCKTGMQNTSTKISGLNWPIINKRKGDLISLQANGKWKTLLEKLFVSYFSNQKKKRKIAIPISKS